MYASRAIIQTIREIREAFQQQHQYLEDEEQQRIDDEAVENDGEDEMETDFDGYDSPNDEENEFDDDEGVDDKDTEFDDYQEEDEDSSDSNSNSSIHGSGVLSIQQIATVTPLETRITRNGSHESSTEGEEAAAEPFSFEYDIEYEDAKLIQIFVILLLSNRAAVRKLLRVYMAQNAINPSRVVEQLPEVPAQRFFEGLTYRE